MRIPVSYGDERPVEPERQAAPPAGPTGPEGKPSPAAGPGQPEAQPSPPAGRDEEEGYLFSIKPARPAAPADDYRDLYLRAMADMANFRRRTEERAREEVEEERRRLLNEFLEFADNLERAVAHQDEPGLRSGLRLTSEGLQRFLAREGVEPVEAAGQPFDPQLHEAVSTVAGAAAGRVVEEVRRGYRYHGRLLRPARVVVGRHESHE